MGVGRRLAQGARFFQRRMLVEGICLGFAVLLLQGSLGPRGWWTLGAALVLAALLSLRLYQASGRFRTQQSGTTGQAAESLQVELLLLCTLYLLLQLTGASGSPLYPVLYLLLTAAGGFDRRAANAAILTGVAAGFEVLAFLATDRSGTTVLAVHLAAILLFPSTVSLLARGWLKAREREFLAKLAREFELAEEKARSYRHQPKTGKVAQDGKPLQAHQREELRLRSSALEVDAALRYLLEVLCYALRSNTVAVYLLNQSQETLTLKAAKSPDELVVDPMPAGEGIIGAVIKSRGTVNPARIRDGSPQLTYYRGKVPVKEFLGVPILDEERLRGVLLADRRVNASFLEDDEMLMNAAAKEVWRLLNTEDTLAAIDADLDGAYLFYVSSQRLSRTVAQQEVVDQVLDSARSLIGGLDFAAIVLKGQPESERLFLRGVQADPEFDRWREDHLMTELPKGGHLCALAVKDGAVYPTVPFHKMQKDKRSVFGIGEPAPTLGSLKVFPLKVPDLEKGKSVPGKEKAIGALVVGSRRAGLFPEDTTVPTGMMRMLEALSDIAAMATQSAERYEQLERLATTDGLTGLHNHRRFQEMLEGAVTEALRYKNPLSLMMADVDFFKKVNDSYGHPVGDEVLKRVARVLGELARATDRVCRIGGEEFAVIMPQTDAAGSHILAERFREEIKRQKFKGDGQDFSVTISLGICTLPDLARQKQELVERADQALYHAKHGGRDRTVHYADVGRAAVPGSQP